MRIGITGKIGSGKSSLSHALAHVLGQHGYRLLDVDALTALVHQDAYFQSKALMIFGTLDRQEISKACFADPDKRVALERASLPRWSELLRSGLLPSKLIIDFPLLMETQIAAPWVDLAIGVEAPDETRALRACSRLGWEPTRFEQVDALQIGQRAKMSFCDVVAPNQAGLAELEHLALRIAAGILDLDHIQERIEPWVGPSAWRLIIRAHMQPHRRYHGPAHLRSLFATLDLIAPELSGDAACALAICYHDFVYEVGDAYAHNEKLSAQTLSRHARDLFPHLLPLPKEDESFGHVALACAMIDATKGHKITDPWLSARPDRLARVQAFLDADLAILGSGSDGQFWDYDEAIGLEFSAVPRPAYHALRASAMASFADTASRPELYLTASAKAWEPVARARLSTLVAKHQRLSQASSPPSLGD
jgi:dephospho-CoA kinase/predicted metal-dependent HD superfamily phosphohydrolase